MNIFYCFRYSEVTCNRYLTDFTCNFRFLQLKRKDYKFQLMQCPSSLGCSGQVSPAQECYDIDKLLSAFPQDHRGHRGYTGQGQGQGVHTVIIALHCSPHGGTTWTDD